MKISVRHHPDRPAPPPPSAPSSNQLSPSSTDDMNATLLKANEANEDPIKRELFGNFKGFSLKPLPMSKPNILGASNVAYVHPVAKAESVNEQCIPSRAAPLPPATNSPKKAPVKSTPASLPKSSPSSFRYQNINTSPKKTPETPIEVKLFASKSDAKERPKISHPVLENSTCSVKELVAAANSNKKPQNSSNTLPKSNALTQNAVPKPSEASSPLKNGLIQKNSVKKLDISAPVKAVSFGRSQSMRSPSTEKAPVKRNVLASGSMRYPPGSKRVNVVDRPKNPPPPRPSNLPGSSASSLRNIYANTNGDGLNSVDNSTDNIYCVIEDVKEVPPPSNGLLNEIVNEIENRNKNSIYSTSKNKGKIPNGKITNNEQIAYENISQNHESTPTLPPEPDNIYMNTASGAEQPLMQNKTKVIKSIEKLHKPNVNSIVKKLTAPGSAKPMIATKPSVSNLIDQKTGLNKETSQNDSTKKPYISRTNSNVSTKAASSSGGKATINPISSVRAMHKRFENRNA